MMKCVQYIYVRENVTHHLPLICQYRVTTSVLHCQEQEQVQIVCSDSYVVNCQ